VCALPPERDQCRTRCATAKLARLFLESGDTEAADAVLTPSLGRLEQPACALARASLLTVSARIALARGDVRGASSSLGQALEACHQSEDTQAMLDALLVQTQLELARGGAGLAYRAARRALALTGPSVAVLMQIRVLEQCALTLPARAAMPLVAAATQQRARRGMLRWPSEAKALATLLPASLDYQPVSIAMALDLARERLGALTAPLEPEAVGALPLTRREREVARLVAHGQSTRQVADTLVISEGTVRAHVERIRTKLGVASRADIARRLGLSQN
jgi:ATP/maltotriose-dependent transcriptional regulator MalT